MKRLLLTTILGLSIFCIEAQRRSPSYTGNRHQKVGTCCKSKRNAPRRTNKKKCCGLGRKKTNTNNHRGHRSGGGCCGGSCSF